MRASHLLLVSVVVMGVAACGSTPPPELKDARNEYARVASSDAARLVPADVHLAGQQLAVANKSFENNGDTQETRDLAYAARRKAELAEVRARTLAEAMQQGDAQAQLRQLREEQVRLTSAELETTRGQLAAVERQMVEAQQAAADLARIASVKQDARGVVITLSGEVIFRSGKADLSPQARSKLDQVAMVLTKQDKDSKLLVQGYTDSRGSSSLNQELSQQRAEAVRTYLVSQGIPADRITAEGLGPSNPIADNASPEGRADNRRVEIVIQPGARSAGATSPQTTKP